MSSIADTIAKHTQAIETLISAFPESTAELYSGETLSQFEFSSPVLDTDWLKEWALTLATSLNSAGYRVVLRVFVYDHTAQLVLRGVSPSLTVNSEASPTDAHPEPGELPTEAVAAFESYCELVEPDKTGISFKRIQDLLVSMADQGVLIRLALLAFLDKKLMQNDFFRDVNRALGQKLLVYLSTEAVLRDLREQSLVNLESNFISAEQRTIVVVLDLLGEGGSDYIAALGRDATDRIERLLAEPLSLQVREESRKRLEFRTAQSIWLYPTRLLLPEMFDLRVERPVDASKWRDIQAEFHELRTLLSAIFLADSITQEESNYRVEYSGFGRVRIPVSRDSLHDCRDGNELYRLYCYSYEGLSADKLEIAQQFLSLIAQDLPSLCSRAKEVGEATKKTYERALVDKVGEYFDARRKIQDRISETVTETSGKIIGLSRDISSDLYKVAGAIAAATAAALLDASITTWAALFAAVVIAAYVAIVLRYYLPTMERAYAIEMEQNENYVRSYQDVLTEEEINTYVHDACLKATSDLFGEKYEHARELYSIALMLAIIVIFIAAGILLSEGATTTTPTAAPTPIP